MVARAAAIMRARRDEFARPMTLETGKLIDQARDEVDLGADILDYYAEHAERFLAPEHLKPSSGEAEVESSASGALMAGNVVMVKHAGCLLQCAVAFETLWSGAGAPVGAYTNLLISHGQVDRVIDDPCVKDVALTGSVEVGKVVAGRAGQNLKKSAMELGGGNAFIVLEDAGLDQAVDGRYWAR